MRRNNWDETEIFSDREFAKIIQFTFRAAMIMIGLLSFIAMLRAVIAY